MNERTSDEERSSHYLSLLSDETMRRAWGAVSKETGRDITLAAVIFSRRFDERSSEIPTDQKDLQRFLMYLMDDVISDFAEARSISRDSASELLGDVAMRDLVLEFDEVIEAYEEGSSDSLDRLLSEAVESRRQRAGWADHWSNG